MTDVQNTDIVVIGGGLAGLTAANFAAKAGCSVTVYEARKRLGGRAVTDDRNGFSLNQGPHALYLAGQASSILTELGISVAGNKPNLDGRFLFDGELFLAPGGPVTLLKTKAIGAKAKLAFGMALSSLPKLSPTDFASMPAAQWVDEFVEDERSRGMVRALIRLTTYASDLESMSADLAVAQLQLGLGEGVRYLDGGWQPMVDALAAAAVATGRVTIVPSSKVSELPDARCVILALNSPQAVSGLTGLDIEVGPPAVTASLDLGLSRKPDLDFALGGQAPMYFSHHSSGSRVAPEGRHLVAVAAYLGGSGPNSFSDAEGASFDRKVLEDFARTCGVKDEDVVESRYLRRMVASSALPTSALGGMAGRPDIDALNHTTGADQTLLVAGDWVGPDAHLADASMLSAKRAAMAAVKAVR